jgi:phosphomannomutase
VIYPTDSLRTRLLYEPRELKFGTSGRRGEVVHLTHLEVYTNVRGELEYLQTLPPEEGGIAAGDPFYVAGDLRPSSAALRQAVEHAVRDAGLRPVYLGTIPTPALTFFALSRGNASIMVTGSHIPFDRNGYKLNTARGELLKHQEEPINHAVQRVRERLYGESFETSPFDEHGALKSPEGALSAAPEGAAFFAHRFTSFFGPGALAGMRILVYQHSAVGRDLLAGLLRSLGAEVLAAGRSETFVPIDTENIEAATLETVQALASQAAAESGALDAVVSTDGDSDRPLILGIGPDGRVRFYGGDLVGMIVAEYLGADAVVVPITCNDGIDRGSLAAVLEPKTRIGSPYVIEGMERARAKGRETVCGWEANGGFLLGSDVKRGGKVLRALATRDAVLPILAVLMAAREKGVALPELFAGLPSRFSRAGLLRNFPRAAALEIVRRLSPADPAIHDAPAAALGDIRARLARVFTPEAGFGPIERLNYTDGVRITFAGGDVVHFRPSGNADEFRIYAYADTEERAAAIVQAGIAEPGGILRTMERQAGETPSSVE